MTIGVIPIRTCEDLEVGKFYKVEGVCYFQRQYNDTIEPCMRITVTGGSFCIPEHCLPLIRLHATRPNLYLLCKSKKYLQQGIEFDVELCEDDQGSVIDTSNDVAGAANF